MNSWHVKYVEYGKELFLGVYYADSKDGAMRQALKQHFPEERNEWGVIQGCLTAKKVG